MSISRIYLDDANVDLQKEFVDKYLGNVDEKLKNNPSFMRQLYSAIYDLTRKTAISFTVPPLELFIADDGKSFEIRGGVRPDPDCFTESLKENKCYEQVRFSIDDKNNMSVLSSMGNFYKFDDFMKAFKGSLLEKQYSIYNSNDTPTICSVYHKNRVFLDSGVEVALSTFSDKYPLGLVTMDSEVQMKAQTMIHSPREWYYNLVPDHASFECNPTRTNAHRFKDSLGIVYLQTTNGKNEPVKLSEYISSSEYPEVLSVNPTPVFEFENGKAKLNSCYQDELQGMNEYEIKKQICIRFLKAVDYSETKNINPEMYETMRKLVADGLESRYQYKEEMQEEALKK